MKITKEADYALRIVAELASEKKQMDAKMISERNNIPYRYTLKILRKIVQAGIIRSYRGINGGYVLYKDPSEITLKDVIEAIDGKIAINKCLEDPTACLNSGVCRVQKRLFNVQTTLASELQKVTFAEILKETDAET